MTDQPRPSEWTFGTLLYHMEKIREADNRFHVAHTKAIDRLMTLQFKRQELAVQETKQAMDKRFEGVNEFRETLSDQQTTFIARTEVLGLFKALSDKVDEVAVSQKQQRDLGGGRAQLWVIVSWAVMVLISVAARFWK